MKKTVKIIISVLLLAAVALSFAACGESGTIKKNIAAFQAACNAADVNAMLEYIEPSTADTVRAAGGFLGALTGQDSTQVLTSLSSLLLKGADAVGSDFFRTLDIKVGKVTVEGTLAYAQAVISYTSIDGASVTRNSVIRCVLNAEQWYISGFDFVEG